VRREKAALSSGCEAHPATIAPAGSNLDLPRFSGEALIHSVAVFSN
jgi:hypothetical protein